MPSPIADIDAERVPPSLVEFLAGNSWRAGLPQGTMQRIPNPIGMWLKRWLLRPSAADLDVLRVTPFDDGGFFERQRIFFVNVRGHHLEGQMLPSGGSFGYCAALDDGTYRYLNRRPGNLSLAFQREGRPLSEGKARPLAELFVECLGRRGNNSHHVVESSADILEYGSHRKGRHNQYVVNSEALEQHGPSLQPPSIIDEDEAWVVRCHTVYGWMHQKTDLISNHYRVDKASFAIERESDVLSRKIFTAVPMIRY